MIKIVKLTDLNEGQKAVVNDIKVELCMKRRLQDLGLIPGSVIECYIKNSQRAITAFLIKDSVIGLRKKDTDLIFIEQRGFDWS